jgi:glucose/arabinose dehydrogenase
MLPPKVSRIQASLPSRLESVAGGPSLPLRAAASHAGILLAALVLGASGAPAQTMSDPILDVTTVLPLFTLAQPTSMEFVGTDDFLVLEKNTGIVRRVQNGVLSPVVALDVAVNAETERGLLGIAVNTGSPQQVFLYYTEADGADGGTPLGNRVYRYTWNPNNGLLESPQLILDLPVLPGTNHDGGALLMGQPSDGASAGDGAFLYVVIGDLNRSGKLQNRVLGPDPDDTSVILRVEQDGSAAAGNPFTPYCTGATTLTCAENADCGASGPCRLEVARYYAYGIRNSFGMARDPLTGALWMTENGPSDYDEINSVESGLNSGWNVLMGPDARDPQGTGDLWNVPGAGLTYSDPEFSWLATIAPTALAFPRKSSFGPQYDGRLLVADANVGRIFSLPLNPARTGFDFTGYAGVEDLVADSAAERDQFQIGDGFFSITDIGFGPDRHLYVVSHGWGTVFRISGPAVAPALGPTGLALLAALLGAAASFALRPMRARASTTFLRRG